MSQKIKAALGIGIFALVLVGAVVAYNILRREVKPETALDDLLSSSAAENSAPQTSTQSSIGLAEESGVLEESTVSEPEEIAAPDFSMVDKDGNPVQLSELIENQQPIVLNFWASWCPPCKSEMPEFETVFKDLGTQVQFVMVNLTDGSRETIEKGSAYIEEQGFTFPVYYDTEQEGAGTYGIYSIPSTLFIDKDGIVITGVQGAIDEATLRKGIELILE